MTDTLEPIHTIPLGSTLTGEVAQAELQFAVENGKPVLYAAVPVWNATWGRWFSWHAPEIMVGVWLVVLIVLVRRLLHVQRTPREAGRRYCRKCNHQLTKPQLAFDERGRVQWASAESKCPECGVRTRRVPVRGRPAWMRRVLFIACTLPILIVLGLMIFGLLQPAPPPTTRATPTWPIAYLDHFMGRYALARRMHPITVQSTRFLRIDPESGTWLDLPATPPTSPGMHGVYLSPTGKRIVVASSDRDALVTIPTSGDRSAELFRPGSRWAGTYSISILRFLTDDRVLVQSVKRTTKGEIVSLDHVDLSNGGMETLVEVPIPPESIQRSASHQFQLAQSSDRLAWLLRTSLWNHRGFAQAEVRWMSADGLQVRSLGGSAAVRPPDIWLGDDGQSFTVSFPTETPEVIALDPRVMPTIVPSETPATNVGSALSQVGTNDGSVVMVHNAAQARRFVLANVNMSSYFGMADSPDGRYVAFVTSVERKSRLKEILTGKPTRLEGEIRIFRIPDPPEK